MISQLHQKPVETTTDALTSRDFDVVVQVGHPTKASMLFRAVKLGNSDSGFVFPWIQQDGRARTSSAFNTANAFSDHVEWAVSFIEKVLQQRVSGTGVLLVSVRVSLGSDSLFGNICLTTVQPTPRFRWHCSTMTTHTLVAKSFSDRDQSMSPKEAAMPSRATDDSPKTPPRHDPCVFVLGCDRSGTTLVQKMLTSHPELHITYETGFSATIRHLHRPNGFEPVLHALEMTPQLSGVDFNGLRDEIRANNAVQFADLIALAYRRVAAHHGKSRWGDKTPAYTRHILPLAMMFPAARFIHVVRDPRAVAVSWVPTNWGPNTFWHAGRTWSDEVGLATADFALLDPWRRLTIRFEDVVRDPDAPCAASATSSTSLGILACSARPPAAMSSYHRHKMRYCIKRRKKTSTQIGPSPGGTSIPRNSDTSRPFAGT